ncbi:MAG: hypothetical protein ACUVTL_07570 [Thermoproteota archaeon]
MMCVKAGGVWIVTVDDCFPTDVLCSSPGGVIDPEGNWLVKFPAKGQHLFSYTIDIG